MPLYPQPFSPPTTPQRFDATDLLAKIYARLGDWRSAVPLWEECRRQQPHNPAIEMALQRAKIELDLADEPIPGGGTGAVSGGGSEAGSVPAGSTAAGGVPGGGTSGRGDDADDPAAGIGADPTPYAPPSVSGRNGGCSNGIHSPSPPGRSAAPPPSVSDPPTSVSDPPPSVSERKARALKALAEDAYDRMHSGRALLLLGEALGMAPHLPDLWSLRSRVYEGLHRYSDALADAQVRHAHPPPSLCVLLQPLRPAPPPKAPPCRTCGRCAHESMRGCIGIPTHCLMRRQVAYHIRLHAPYPHAPPHPLKHPPLLDLW
jgi:hypothetical protein